MLWVDRSHTSLPIDWCALKLKDPKTPAEDKPRITEYSIKADTYSLEEIGKIIKDEEVSAIEETTGSFCHPNQVA